jgi:murein DD-endopeptidase MepM/ murein hydrolase activator NlpD
MRGRALAWLAAGLMVLIASVSNPAAFTTTASASCTTVQSQPTATPSPAPTSTPQPTPCPSPSAAGTPAPKPTSPPPATPDPAAQQRAQQLLQQVQVRLNANLSAALGVQLQLTQSLTENDREQADLSRRVTEAEAQIQALDDQIFVLEQQIAQTQDQIDRDRAQAAELARSLYFTPDSLLLSIVNAGSLKDLMTAASDNLVAGARAEAIQKRLAEEIKRLNDAQAAASAAREEKIKTAESLQAHIDRLVELQASQLDLAQQIDDQLYQIRTEVQRAGSQSPDLVQQILAMLDSQQASIYQASIEQVWTQVQVWRESTGGPPPQPLSTGHSKRYPLTWPEPGGMITQGFGPTTLALAPPFGGYPHFHTGLDIAGPEWTPVLAADDGVVAVVGSGNFGYGNYVVLAHSGNRVSLYGHLNRVLVGQGQLITQGQQIGLEGSTGNSTGPHVHFELRLNDVPVDPTPYLPPGPPSSIGLNGA